LEKFIMLRFASISVCFLLALATACTHTPPEQALPAPSARQTEPLMFSLQPDWRLTRLDGQNVSVGASGAVYLSFTEDNRVTGYGGCNRILGAYLREGRRITFSRMASTRRACLTGMKTEDLFFKTLEAVQSWDMTGNDTILRFYDADKRLRLEFQISEDRDQ
jgi:putative lipoprotein